MSALTRRAVMRGAAVLPFGAACMPALAHDPAVAAVAHLDDIRRAWRSDPDETDTAFDWHSDRYLAALDDLIEAPAPTMRGLLAKLETLRDEADIASWDDTGGCLLDAIIEDVRRLAR